jgi:hypothetical protein
MESLKQKPKSKLMKNFKKYHFFYIFAGFCVLGNLFLHSHIGPEWLLRLIFECVSLIWGVGWALWLGLLAPSSMLVVQTLLESDLWPLRLFWEGLARTMFTGIAVVLIWGSIFPLGKGIVSLFRVGTNALVVRQATVEKVDELGVTGFIYQIVYVEKQEKALDYFWGFSDFLSKGNQYQFLILDGSQSILQVKHLSD